MTRWLALSASILFSGCSLFPRAQHGSGPATGESASAAAAPEAEIVRAPMSSRNLGDVSVYRVGGSYRSHPLLLTEEVVAREGSLWVIDYTMTEDASSEKLRVRMDDAGRVVRAARVEPDGEVPTSLAAYENFIGKTVFAADQNDGLLGDERGTCIVGPNELDCQTKRYRVFVEGSEATLRVSRSSALPNRDIAGEITAQDGRVIYRSELIELRQQQPSSSFASR